MCSSPRNRDLVFSGHGLRFDALGTLDRQLFRIVCIAVVRIQHDSQATLPVGTQLTTGYRYQTHQQDLRGKKRAAVVLNVDGVGAVPSPGGGGGGPIGARIFRGAGDPGVETAGGDGGGCGGVSQRAGPCRG